MNLRAIEFEIYAAEVLPHTAELWAGERAQDRYVEQTGEIAHCGYGRRHYRTVGLYDGDRLVASFKRYERTLRAGTGRLRAAGIGAVFTPPELRGLLRGIKEKHMAGWVDEQIPALGGMTPREAAKKPASRAQLDLLLRDMENHESQMPADERYDFDRVREALGLSE